MHDELLGGATHTELAERRRLQLTAEDVMAMPSNCR
jgi:hypothetical protein